MSSEGARAYEVMDRVPDGCRLVLVNDNLNWPHLRTGEWAVIDVGDTEVVDGELFLVNMGRREAIKQVIRRKEGIWFCPFNRPRTYEECKQWMREGRELVTNDGPLREEYLPEKMLGRVVGIYESSFDESQLVTVSP